jgi:hypothetical protein
MSMETGAASSSSATAAIPQEQGPSSSETQVLGAPEGVGDAFTGSETAQELETSLKRCEAP